MNDGVAALLVQWCLLLLVWMGSADRPLAKLGLSRRQALALLALSLVCFPLSWNAPFAPVAVNPGGTVLPLLLASWLWTFQSNRQKAYLSAAAMLFAALVFLFRKLMFWDPVLMIVDEKLLVPLLALLTLNLLKRDWRQQCLIALIGLPLSDVLWQFSVISQAEQIQLGGKAALDLLWVTAGLWAAFAITWSAAKQGAARAIRFLAVTFRGRATTKPHR